MSEAPEFVCVPCHRHDAHFARAAVASVRHYAPDIRILLIKDLIFGDFPVWDLERAWGCEVLRTPVRKFGWGFAKLEPLFLDGRQRFFAMDTDVLWLGDMRLKCAGPDFVVDEENPAAELVATNYFDLAALKVFDPAFVWPGYTFNTGQWAGTSGLLSRSDFSALVSWGEPRGALREDVFRLGEQGLQNYLFQKLAAEGRITLERRPIMRVGDTAEVAGIRLDEVKAGRDLGFVAHWCGLKRAAFAAMHRGDLWRFFERRHYARVPCGRLLLLAREIARRMETRVRPLLRAARNRLTGRR